MAPSSVNEITEIEGLNPALEARQFQKPSVLACQNVLLDAQGPYSAFGDNLVSEEVISNIERFQTFRISSETLIFTEGVILRYNSVAQRYYPAFQFTDSAYDTPWTQARCGLKYYFAKRGVGMIVYTPASGDFILASGGSYPSNIVAVTQSNGRLCAITDSIIGWTKIDDGSDWTTSTVTGAGSVALALLGSGDPLSVLQNSVGFAAFSETGLCVMKFVNATIPFKYSPIGDTTAPLNAWCIIAGELNEIIYLDLTGFKNLKADLPEPYQPGMGEYLARTLLPQLDLTQGSIVRLTYNKQKRWFMVSLAQAASPYVYTRAFVNYLNINKWGSFDELHAGFGELYITTGANFGYNFGYLDTSGYFHRFNELARRESSAVEAGATYWQTNFDPPATPSGTTLKFYTFAHGDALNFAAFPPSTAGVYEYAIGAGTDNDPVNISANQVSEQGSSNGSGLEDWNLLTDTEDWNTSTASDEDWNGDWGTVMRTSSVGQSRYDTYSWVPAAHEYSSINSYADIGLVRFTDGTYHDTVSTIIGLSVGCNAQIQYSYEDWNTSTMPDEDWNSLTGNEDWGSNFPTSNDFTFTAYGTLDGSSTWGNNEKEFTDADLSAENSNFYNFTNTGIYHKFRLSALDDNQFFHLKTMSITGTLGGRVQ